VSRILVFIVKNTITIIFLHVSWLTPFFTCRNLEKNYAGTLKKQLGREYRHVHASESVIRHACGIGHALTRTTILGTLCTSAA